MSTATAWNWCRPGDRRGVALAGTLRLIADLCEHAAEANPGRPITGPMVRAIVGGAV